MWTKIKQLTHLSSAIKDGTEFCTSFNNMSQHSKDKLPTPGLKRKLKTHTIETKFQAIAVTFHINSYLSVYVQCL